LTVGVFVGTRSRIRKEGSY